MNSSIKQIVNVYKNGLECGVSYSKPNLNRIVGGEIAVEQRRI